MIRDPRALVLLLAFVAAGLPAQTVEPLAGVPQGKQQEGGDSLDELFQDLNSDVVVSGSEPAPVHQAPDRPMFLYFGTLETQGILAGGWKDEGRTAFASSLYYFLHLQGGIDVKPIPEARLIGTFSTFLPQDLDSKIVTSLKDGNTQSNVPGTTATSVNTSSSLSLDELYLDYDILRSATFRIGKFGETWGQGRIFNPGNLVSDTSGSVNLRGFVPLGPVNLTGLVVGSTGFFAVKEKPKAEELGYAGKLEWNLGQTIFGPWVLGLSGYHQLVKGSIVDASFRTAFLDFDLYSEVLFSQRFGPGWRPGLLLGTDREIDLGFKIRAAAEYWHSETEKGEVWRSLGLGITTNGFGPASLRLSSKWIHSLTDGSGQLVGALTATPLPKLDFVLAFPWTYGPSSGTYVAGNSDPEKRLLAAMLSINVKLDFEKEH